MLCFMRPPAPTIPTTPLDIDRNLLEESVSNKHNSEQMSLCRKLSERVVGFTTTPHVMLPADVLGFIKKQRDSTFRLPAYAKR
jgi:hypothetical protein